MQRRLKIVLQTGRLNLTKFLSNKRSTLEKVPDEDKEEIKSQRILDQTWDAKNDKLLFTKPKLLYTGQQLTQT